MRYTVISLTNTELEFARGLSLLDVPILTAPPGSNGSEFCRPKGWQQATRDDNDARIACHRRGNALFGVMGGRVAVVDVDTKKGASIERVREELDRLGIRIYAEIATPSGERHFYVAGHPDLPSVSNLNGWYGIDVQSYGRNAFLPGTTRPKYDGAAYEIVFNDLGTLADSGDESSGEALADWVARHRPKGNVEQFLPGPEWVDGTPHDGRQSAYLAKVLDNTHQRIAGTAAGDRNTALFNGAMACGNYVAGAGLDEQKAVQTLTDAAEACGLTAEDGEHSVLATIRSGLRVGRQKPRAVPATRSLPKEVGFTLMPAGESVIPVTEGAHDDEDFWNSRPVLRHIKQAALARMCSPWAVLAVVLARVLVKVPPHVVLPPLVGGHASLNSVSRSSPPPVEAKGQRVPAPQRSSTSETSTPFSRDPAKGSPTPSPTTRSRTGSG